MFLLHHFRSDSFCDVYSIRNRLYHFRWFIITNLLTVYRSQRCRSIIRSGRILKCRMMRMTLILTSTLPLFSGALGISISHYRSKLCFDNRFFRWRHQARLERMAEQKIEKEELEKKKGTTSSKIEVRIWNFEICWFLNISNDDLGSEQEVGRFFIVWGREESGGSWNCWDQEARGGFQKERGWARGTTFSVSFFIVDCFKEKERLQPWNVDTIGTVKIDKTRITKVGEKKPETKNISDEEDSKRMYKYFDEHESKLKVFSRLEGLDKTEEYMLEVSIQRWYHWFNIVIIVSPSCFGIRCQLDYYRGP